jgi:hypothetical protein
MFVIRPMQPDDEPFQWDMGWEAAAMSAEWRAAGRDTVMALPQLRRYFVGMGRPGDGGVVAVAGDGARLGVAWYRLFPPEDPGFGFVAPDVPELGIGVLAKVSEAHCSTRSWRWPGSKGSGRSAWRWIARTPLLAGCMSARGSATRASPTRPTAG